MPNTPDSGGRKPAKKKTAASKAIAKKTTAAKRTVKKIAPVKQPVRPLDRIAALLVGITQIGRHEVGKNNWGPQVKLYLASTNISYPAAWCMAFIHWCYLQVGVTLGGAASVGNFVEWARKHGEIITRPFKGDLVAFQFDSDNWPDHVGFVERVLSIRIAGCWLLQTIEGNTGATGAVSDPGTGRDAVYRKRRLVRRNRVIFVRIKGQV